jgi:hypothetical protein
MSGQKEHKTWGPFNGRHLTVIVVALIIGAVLIPSTVWAVDTFSNVAIEDPVSGAKASVDSTHHVLVSASGTVNARPVLNTKAWSMSGLFYYNHPANIHGPVTSGMAVTNVVVANQSSTAVDARLFLSVGAGGSTILPFTVGPGQTLSLPFVEGGWTEKTANSTLQLLADTNGPTLWYMASGYDL